MHCVELCGTDDPAFGAQTEGSDVCCAPVLDWDEAPRHPPNRARGAFIDIGGAMQPAPRFSRTPAATPQASATGTDSEAILRDWGIAANGIDQLKRDGTNQAEQQAPAGLKAHRLIIRK